MEIILTVEDDEDVRDYIKMYLLEWGHTVNRAITQTNWDLPAI